MLVKGTSVQVELSGGTSPLSPLVRLQGFIGGFYWPGPHIVDFRFLAKTTTTPRCGFPAFGDHEFLLEKFVGTMLECFPGEIYTYDMH